MSKSAAVTRSWSGGVSVDKKLGPDNSFKKSLSINHRKKASSIELHKKFVKESGTTVDTMVHQGIRAPDSSIYFMGDTKIYRRTVDTFGSPGAYSVFQSGLTNIKSGSYNRDRKRIYIPADKSIHAIKYDSTPTFTADVAAQLKDLEVINTGTLAYTLPTSISEAAVDKITFQPDIEPYIRMGFWVLAKGSGSITVTMHDAANTVLATVTVPNASVVVGQNYITFPSQVRLSAQPNPYTYHFHITSSAGSTTVRTATASDLSKADYVTYADALISGVYHPCGEFLQYVVIGNGNYVAAWEPITDAPTKTEYLPHRLKLPSEYTVLGFAEYKEYYAISAYKSVSSDYGGGDQGVNSTEGLIGFWDGASRGFAWFVKVEGGAMEGIYVKDGFIYGYVNGVLHVTSGDTPVPVYEMPGFVDFTSTKGHSDDVYLKAPYNAMTVRDNVMLMAYPALTANESMTPTVYSFGRKTKDFAESIAQDHVPSHGQTVPQFVGTVPQSGITYIGTFGKNTFMAWSTVISGVVTYGIDVLNNANPCYDSGYLEYLDMDNNITYREKEGVFAVATYEKRPENSTIRLFYTKNGDPTRIYGSAQDVTDDTEKKQVRLSIPTSYRVISYGVELTASTTNKLSPVIDSTAIVIEKNEKEGL